MYSKITKIYKSFLRGEIVKVYMSSNNFNKKQSKKIVSNKEVFSKKSPKVYDELFEDVKEFIKGKGYIRIGEIQEKFGLGYPRARKIMQQLIQDCYIFEEVRYRVAPSEYFITYTDDDLK